MADVKDDTNGDAVVEKKDAKKVVTDAEGDVKMDDDKAIANGEDVKEEKAEDAKEVKKDVTNGNGVTEASDLEKKIIRQIEHYFGDYNMSRDKFLQETVKANDGWVEMETMLKFKRLSELSEDADVILAAMKKSTSGMMEIAGDGKAGKIRRSPSLPLPENTEDFKKTTEARTVYAKGFEKEKTTLDDLLTFFHGSFQNVENIQMRHWFDKKTKEKHFKGSVFVTFKDIDSAKKFSELEDVKYQDEPLVRMFQKDYFEVKSKEFEEKKRSRHGDRDKVKKAKADAKQEEQQENKEEELVLAKGATLKLTGFSGDISREDIKEKLKDDFEVNIDRDGGDIAFITFNKGDEVALIRFRAENAAKPIAEKWIAKEKVEINEIEIKGSLLEGEEETKFLADAVQDLKDRRNKNRQGHKRRGGFQGGRGGKRGRR